MNQVLERWNGFPIEKASDELLSCCGSRTWAGRVAEARPYADEDALFKMASAVWQRLDPEDWLRAFRSHPRIGERHAEKHPTQISSAWSATEQKNVQEATVAMRQAIEDGNRRYEERFGRIFIVCAAGKRPSEILEILERRLANDSDTELIESAAQQEQILQLRLRKWLCEEGVDLSGISTHVLDTALGKPASGIVVHLERAVESGAWQTLASQQTDGDGRCRRLLPANMTMQAGHYRLRFETASYYQAQLLQGLYPAVEITFIVRASDAHLHIPLLLTANGYTTYRGT